LSLEHHVLEHVAMPVLPASSSAEPARMEDDKRPEGGVPFNHKEHHAVLEAKLLNVKVDFF